MYSNIYDVEKWFVVTKGLENDILVYKFGLSTLFYSWAESRGVTHVSATVLTSEEKLAKFSLNSHNYISLNNYDLEKRFVVKKKSLKWHCGV